MRQTNYHTHALWIVFQLLCLCFLGCSSTFDTKDESDRFIDSLLATLSVEQKVGQMTQINLPVVLKKDDSGRIVHPVEIDTMLLNEALCEKHIGSLINTADRALAIEEWHYIFSTIRFVSSSCSDSEVPIIYGIDAIHGANYVQGSTLFPHQLAQAASWNESLIRQAAAITAVQTIAAGIHWVFSPILDVARQPLWTQFFETYGEDPLVVSRMGAAAIEGYSLPSRRVVATAKHFVGYGFPFSGRDRTSVHLSERFLREIYLPPFKTAIKSGVQCVMIGSNDLNGIPLHSHGYLINEVLRKELGFDGVVLSDWGDIEGLHRLHKISADNMESVEIAIEAGIDMAMVPNDYHFTNDLLSLVEQGKIHESRIDASVKRILRLKQSAGLLNSSNERDLEGAAQTFSNNKVAYALASEAITLLSNKDNILPLTSDTRVMVSGAASNSLAFLNGAWSRTWQGNDSLIENDSAATVLQALGHQSNNIEFVAGQSIDTNLNLIGCVSAALRNDVVLLVLGESPATEKPGDISNLLISDAQTKLVQTMLATGKPVIVVLVQNRPQIVSHFVTQCSAVLQAYLPGNAGGEAIADVLLGKVNPSGKLPFTYPRQVNDFATYDHRNTDRVATNYSMEAFRPQWPFGHGLHFGEVRYRELQLQKDTLDLDDTLHVSITVDNQSGRQVKEAVLVYVSDEIASVAPPVKRLRAFKKLVIEARQSLTTDFRIPVIELKYVGRDGKSMVLEAGRHYVSVGGQSLSFQLIQSRNNL